MTRSRSSFGWLNCASITCWRLRKSMTVMPSLALGFDYREQIGLLAMKQHHRVLQRSSPKHLFRSAHRKGAGAGLRPAHLRTRAAGRRRSEACADRAGQNRPRLAWRRHARAAPGPCPSFHPRACRPRKCGLRRQRPRRGPRRPFLSRAGFRAAGQAPSARLAREDRRTTGRSVRGDPAAACTHPDSGYADSCPSRRRVICGAFA